MGYYDQADPIEMTLKLECEEPGCENVAEYDVQINPQGGYYEWKCSKCDTPHDGEWENPGPDSDLAMDAARDAALEER